MRVAQAGAIVSPMDTTPISRRPRAPMNTALIAPHVQTPDQVDLDCHHPPRDWSDRVAHGITLVLRFLADTFFAKRYGNRAIVLETVAAVPGLVGAALVHLRCLR